MFSRRTPPQLLVPLFSLTILALLAPAWSNGPPASSKDGARTITAAVAAPDDVDPLPVQPGQVIDERSDLPGWLVQLNLQSDSTWDGLLRSRQAVDAVLQDAKGIAAVTQRYDHALVGFAAFMSPADVRASCLRIRGSDGSRPTCSPGAVRRSVTPGRKATSSIPT